LAECAVYALSSDSPNPVLKELSAHRFDQFGANVDVQNLSSIGLMSNQDISGQDACLIEWLVPIGLADQLAITKELNQMHILEEIRADAGINHDMTMFQLRLIEPIPWPMPA
jgi:hypothetical protein